MSKTNGSDNGTASAVYVGWGTFKNAIIDGFPEGLPNVIDKSIFVGMAGGVQSHMMSGLKFLGLIDDDGHPTDVMAALTSGDDEKSKATLAQILRAKYATLIAIGLERASMKQLLDMLESYRVNGDTKEKAARFFISAAQYASIPLSRHILDGAISAGRRRAAKRASSPEIPSAAASAPSVTAPAPAPGNQTGGERRVIKLASGGCLLTMSTSVGFMNLAKSDREFVSRLIDQIEEYEEQNPESEADQ